MSLYQTRGASLRLVCSLSDTEVERMKPTPPESLRLVSPEQFLASGESQVGVFRRHAGLTSSSSVLDPGCGAGRHALALLDVLDPDSGGKYVGLDVEKERIDWCRRSITPRWGHMRFFHLDVESPMFNPGGHLRLADDDFQLPVRDHAFDLVIFWSLFTHLRPEGVEFYFREVARLLSDQGAAFVTAYLWTPVAAVEVADGQPRFTFEHDMGVWRAHRIDQPEWAVAYKQDWWEERLAAWGLHVDWLHLGNWRREPTHGQDMMVIRRLRMGNTPTG